MKKFLVFTVLLVSSFYKSFACGYSPYGEDVRYCLFKPDFFNYTQYKSFFYNADLWGFDYGRNPQDYKLNVDANIADWYNYTNKKVSVNAIEDFNFNLSYTDIHSKSDNQFIKYLYQNNKTSAIAYLKMAKNCEMVSSDTEDVWERNQNLNDQGKAELLNKIIEVTNKEQDQYFKRKYAFLTIRLAYYSGDKDVIKSIFQTNFKKGKKDYLYYWSLFFYTFTKSNPGYMVDVANLMANSPEKSYASYYYFHHDFKIQKALKYAESKEERANVYAYASVQKVDKNLDYLKGIYENNPKSQILGFLLLREVNKIEDWVYTPYYTNYNPSTDFSNYWSNDKIKVTTETLRNRSENDRLYAKEVLDFINKIDADKMQNPIVWEASKINLEFITRNYTDCLKNISLFEKKYQSEKIFEEIEKIKALCLTANQENGKAIIKPEIESIILKYKSDERFIFALGRELEFKGNIIDGMALLSLIEGTTDGGYNTDDVEWRDNRIKKSGNLQEFYRYFDYLDFVYSAKDLQKIVNRLDKGFETEFQKEIYFKLLRDKDYLKDLLGTKYLRENQLKNALITFKSLDKKYWDDNYNAWERGEYGDAYVFDQNPFYDFKHTKNFIQHKEKYIVTKLAVTERIIKYTDLGNDVKTKDRDYYYFLLANCYYNMSDYGNSWMMRRYNSYGYQSSNQNESYVDEIEYRNKSKALEYYKLAYQNAKTNKFKALCLRMMDYVEKNEYTDSKKVAKEFPEYSSDLSGCENLENYFKARR